jgi:hypothetical protein
MTEVIKETPAEAPVEAPEKSAPVEKEAPEAPEVESDDPPAVASEADDDDADDPLTLSKEHLTAIKANPALRAVYKEMTRGLNRKFQSISGDVQLIQAIKENPREAALMIAQAAGLKIAEEAPAVDVHKKEADAVLAELELAVGSDIARALKPALEKIADAIVAKQIAPVREIAERNQAQTLTARSNAEVETFKAKHKGEITPDIEKKMVALSHKIPAGNDTDPVEYMEILYTVVTGGKLKKESVAEVAKRMASNAEKEEPKGNVGSSRVKSDLDLKGKNMSEAWDLAFERAKQMALDK